MVVEMEGPRGGRAVSHAGVGWARLVTTGAPGSVRATGYVELKGQTVAGIRFHDPAMARQPNLYASNLPLATAHPMMVLKNTGPTALVATPRFFPAEGYPTTAVALPAITLEGGAAAAVDLAPLVRAAAERPELAQVSVAVESTGGPTVPAWLLGPATGSPIEFSAALANASVPAGLEIHQPDDVFPAVWPPTFQLDVTRRISVTQLVETFNSRRQDYRASVTPAGVVVIRPVERRHPFLDAASQMTETLTVTGVMSAAIRIFTPLDRSLADPQAGSGSLSGENIPIVLNGTGRTVIDTLNQIVAQAPGRTWVVTTRSEGDDQRVIEFGFLEGNGSRRRKLMSGGG